MKGELLAREHSHVDVMGGYAGGAIHMSVHAMGEPHSTFVIMPKRTAIALARRILAQIAYDEGKADRRPHRDLWFVDRELTPPGT